MRSADEVGGISVFARNNIEELLKIDHTNEYILSYKSNKHFDCYKGFKNCKEIPLPGRSKTIWDQVKIPLAVMRERVALFSTPSSLCRC